MTLRRPRPHRLNPTLACAVSALLLPAPPLVAQPTEPASDEQRAHALEAQGVTAFNDRDFDQAAEIFEAQRQLTPKSFIVHFNLACTRSLLGDLDEAEERIARAIELGFDDVHKFRLDPTLAPLRERPIYSDLLNRWPQILELRRQSIITRDKSWTRARYTERTDTDKRIEVRSAHGDAATDLALNDLNAVHQFLIDELFSELPDEPWHSHHPWVVVVMPSTRDFNSWARHAVGGAARGLASVGGAYDHDAKRLVSQDLGTTLWHEYAHLLHFRDMARNNQAHALWIKEGLGALVETSDSNGSSITPAACWRINSLKRSKERGILRPVQELIDLTPDQFSGSSTLRNYAHVRAVFLYLHQQGLLKPFYDSYVKTYTQDPTGTAALTQTTGGSLEEFDQALAAWLDAQPMIAEVLADLDVAIGAKLDAGTGDGPKVAGFGPATKGSDALKLGSVITHINSHPVRDIHELARVLEKHTAGDTLSLTARRGKLVTQVKSTLVER